MVTETLSAKIFSASLSQPGRANEDAFWIGRLPEFPTAAVFDGEGNAEGAAKKAVRQLERLYRDGHGILDWIKVAKILDSHWWARAKPRWLRLACPGLDCRSAQLAISRAYLFREGQVRILTENAGKRKLGSGTVEPLIIELPAHDRDLILLMTDGAWTPFSPHALGQVVMKSLASLPELPSAILREAGKRGVYDDMTVVSVQVRN